MFDHGYALLIGVDQYDDARLQLPVVAKDVEKLKEVISHPDRCAYVEQNVRVVTAENANRANILNGLDWLEEQLKRDTSGNETALIYYSGHGHHDKKSGRYYLLPSDTKYPFSLHALEASLVAEKIANMNPRRLFVVLDCCHAAGMEVKGDVDDETITPTAITTKTPAADLAQGRGRAILSSSHGSEKSWIREDGKMSVFTYHLAEALIGHAGRVESHEVLVTEVMDYVAKTVPKTVESERGESQIPDFQLSGTAFPIALVVGGKGIAKGAKAPGPFEKLRVITTVKVGDVKEKSTVKGGEMEDAPREGHHQFDVEAGNIEGESTVIGLQIKKSLKI